MKRNLNLATNIVRSNFGRLPFPYKLTFCITYWCNYACKTCNIWQRRPSNELTLDEIRLFFRKSNRFNWIDFTGGEVWLRKDFEQIIQSAIQECPHLAMLHFPTNGYLTDRIVEGVRNILGMNPPKFVITVSMDGDERLNDEIRGKAGGWKRQVETYKRLHELPGVRVFLGMTLSTYNAHQYDTAFAAAKRECPWLTPDDFHMNIAHSSAHYYGNTTTGAVNPDKEQVLEDVRHYRKKRGLPLTPIAVMENTYLKKAEHFLKTGITPMRCHALHSSCFIDSWGDVYPCGMYDVKVASLREHDYDLQAIWELPRTHALQQEIWNYHCPQCWTPCEAYQSIFGNLMGMHNTRHAPSDESR